MKLNKLILLFSTILIILLALWITPVLTDQFSSPQEAADWTKDKVNAFLHKYNIGYDKQDDESKLTKKVQEYEKLARNNAHYFGTKVDHFINGIKINLEQQHEMTQHDIDGVLADVQHRLRQLELQGQLSRDKVDQAIDKVHHRLANKKSISESFWKTMKNDVSTQFAESYYRPTTWYQRIFSSSPSSSMKSAADDAKASIDQWLDHVQDSLRDLKVLSENQVEAVMDQIRQAITDANINKIASKHWYERLYHRLEKKAKLTELQAEQIKDTLEREINAYKVFASDYVGSKVGQSKAWADDIYQQCCDMASSTKSSMEDWFYYILARFHDSVKTLQHHQQQIKDKTAGDWKDAKESAIKKEHDLKRDFDRYWQSKHLEAYRRLGYSEAQIDHMKKSIISMLSNQQSAAHRNIDQALDSLKQYMQNARVQTSSQIQAEIDKLKQQLDRWKSRFT
ncbi:uncharacterized protein BX664DRAFT_347617 [Halteromyces radiatus]|uniref:uncharacterized protein n=1 Tax=Halteromyces radiatus TaxID=101107 RepID=UPI002220180A|nr:uncharacterized protein BX664DRAFT_347617 [Halteromyces radiatus]KAI8097656.1 hypothetical protein BX664DRAFT_347617 [Halteromyces radiatus]